MLRFVTTQSSSVQIDEAMKTYQSQLTPQNEASRPN